MARRPAAPTFELAPAARRADQDATESATEAEEDSPFSLVDSWTPGQLSAESELAIFPWSEDDEPPCSADPDAPVVVVPTVDVDDCPATVRTPRLTALPSPAAVPVFDDEPVSRPVEVDSAPLLEDVADDEAEEEFFRMQSYPPVVADLDEAMDLAPAAEAEERDGEPGFGARPEQLARRGRLRRVVGVAVAVAALFVGVATVKTVVAAASDSAAEPERASLTEALDSNPAALAAPVAAAQTEQPSSSPTRAGSADGPATPATEPAAAEDTRRLAQQTVQLLDQRKFDEAVPLARTLIASDRTDAFGYLCLGSALQDQGKWQEARQAYSECLRHAERGAVNECAALGGQR